MTLPDKAPPGWGGDLLTAYFDGAQENQYATFHNHPMAKRLIRVDALISQFVNGTINPRPRLPMLFMLRAHSAYRVAAAAAMAGQVYEVNGLARSVLELVSYGAFIGDDETRFKTWISRHDSVQAKKTVRNEFTFGAIRDHLKLMSGPLTDVYVQLYETTIDMGAHPNERGFFSSMTMKDGQGTKEIQQVYLHANGAQLESGLSMTYKVGMWMLQMGQLLWTAKFELLGIREALDELRANPPPKVVI